METLFVAILAAIGVKSPVMAGLIVSIIGPIIYRLVGLLMEKINFNPNKLKTPVGRVIIAVVKALFGSVVTELNATPPDTPEGRATVLAKLKQKFPILNDQVTTEVADLTTKELDKLDAISKGE